MIRCDRKAGHGGRCSWDLGDPDGEADTALKADGFDAAIIGVTASQPGRQALVVYDLDRMIKILGRRDGLSEDDALEHLMFNTVGAWLGKGTPIFVWRKWGKAGDFLAKHLDGES